MRATQEGAQTYMRHVRQFPISDRITIIVPVYNSEAYLEACLSSLNAQTDDKGNPLDDFNVLVLDDGSTDGSDIIAKGFVTEHPNHFAYIHHANAGVSRTRNEGIRLCETEYVMFMDNDDVIEPDFIWTHLQAIEQADADIVISGYKRTDGIKTFDEMAPTKSPWTKYRFLAPWAKIYRTSFLKENELKFFENNIGEDVVFLLNAYSKTEKIKPIPYAGYLWRVNNASISNSIQRGLQDECRVDRVLTALDCVHIPHEEDLLDYFRFRYRVWYLLFSGAYAKPERFEEVATELFGGFSSSIAKTISPFSGRIKGEPIANRMSVFLFKILRQLQAYKLFARIYCKN